MRCYYDLHIHTALSPCGDDDMTPNNIVNMALIKELDIIAITDHNSCQNAEAVMNVAEGTGLVVIPGLEVETREEIHVICLFPDVEKATRMQEIVYDHLPSLKNNPALFGHQYIMNDLDEIIEENERLLLTATDLSIGEVCENARNLLGVPIPAHVDRPTYSIVSNLGWIPEELSMKTIEISYGQQSQKQKKIYDKYQIIQSSDAHYLGDIAEKNHYLELERKTIKEIIHTL